MYSEVNFKFGLSVHLIQLNEKRALSISQGRKETAFPVDTKNRKQDKNSVSIPGYIVQKTSTGFLREFGNIPGNIPATFPHLFRNIKNGNFRFFVVC